MSDSGRCHGDGGEPTNGFLAKLFGLSGARVQAPRRAQRDNGTRNDDGPRRLVVRSPRDMDNPTSTRQLTLPALRRRIDHGELPPPAGHRPGGWPYWDAGDIQDWLEQSPHPRCPICQARLKRLDVHMLRRHGARTSPS